MENFAIPVNFIPKYWFLSVYKYYGRACVQVRGEVFIPLFISSKYAYCDFKLTTWTFSLIFQKNTNVVLQKAVPKNTLNMDEQSSSILFEHQHLLFSLPVVK